MSSEYGDEPGGSRGASDESLVPADAAPSESLDPREPRETVTAEDIQPQVVYGTGTRRTTLTAVATSTPIPDAVMLAAYKDVGGETMMQRVFEESIESWRQREALERRIVEHQIAMDCRESELRQRNSEQIAKSRLAGTRSALVIALACVALVAYGLFLGADFWPVGWSLLVVAILAAVLLSKDQSPIRALAGALKALRGRRDPKQLELFGSNDDSGEP